MRRAASILALAALIGVGTACGTHKDMSDAAQRRLSALVGRVRTTAHARDVAGAGQALSELRGAVHSYEQAGSLSSARGTKILGAATQVQHELVLITTTTTTTTPAPPPAPPAPKDKHDHGKHGGDHHGPKDQGD